MAGVRQPAGVGAVVERRRDLGADDDPAERHVAGVHALGERDQVGRHAPVVDGEPLAGAAEAGHDLVGDEHDAVAVAELADARRGSRPAAPGSRRCPGTVSSTIGRDRRRTFERDHLLEVLQRALRPPRPRSSRGTPSGRGTGPKKCTTPVAPPSLAQRRGSPVMLDRRRGVAVVPAVGRRGSCAGRCAAGPSGRRSRSPRRRRW